MRGRDDVVGERGDVGGVLDHDAQDGSDGEVLRAGGLGDLREEAVLHRLERHGRLVGLDVRDDVAGGDRVALLDLPLRDVTLGHRGRERGHTKLLRAGGSAGRRRDERYFFRAKVRPEGGGSERRGTHHVRREGGKRERSRRERAGRARGCARETPEAPRGGEKRRHACGRVCGSRAAREGNTVVRGSRGERTGELISSIGRIRRVMTGC